MEKYTENGRIFSMSFSLPFDIKNFHTLLFSFSSTSSRLFVWNIGDRTIYTRAKTCNFNFRPIVYRPSRLFIDRESSRGEIQIFASSLRERKLGNLLLNVESPGKCIYLVFRLAFPRIIRDEIHLFAIDEVSIDNSLREKYKFKMESALWKFEISNEIVTCAYKIVRNVTYRELITSITEESSRFSKCFVIWKWKHLINQLYLSNFDIFRPYYFLV